MLPLVVIVLPRCSLLMMTLGWIQIVLRTFIALLLSSFWGLNALAQTDFIILANGRLLASDPGTDIEIVDGDTLWLGIHQIRLYGIDALEPKQPCVAEGKARSYCHLSASNRLREFASHSDFSCQIHVKDGEKKPWIRYGRYVATCYVGETDINLKLVEEGWAYPAHTQHGDIYRGKEQSAKKRKLGIHATEHDPPWEWRKAQRDDKCSCE